VSSTIPAPAQRRRRASQVGLPLAIVSIVVLLVVPIPPLMLDVLLAVNLSLAFLILVASLMINRALDFSVFPSLLLVTTLARLALNVSSTRLILTKGHAGEVIQAFGSFVIGGNLIVGLVIFLILIVIQFAVITAGATRVAEVSARFTLDAMPGKQMAIDADLNAGLIDEQQARSRRSEIASEADFYGAMDGASKFVKGDAIAAVVLVVINLIAGLGVGVMQMGLGISDAVHKFSLLSVGDGLVSQIPALLISVSSGILVTRVTRDTGMPTGVLGGGLGGEVIAQLGRNPLVLRIAGTMVAVMGLMPGLPKLPFFVLTGALFLAASRSAATLEQESALDRVEAQAQDAPPEDSGEVDPAGLAVDPLRLDLSADLLDLLDPSLGDLPGRVKALRRRIASDLGIIVPPLRTADDPMLPGSTYAIRVNGVELARGEAPVGCSLVLDDGSGRLPGRQTVDPVFGTPAAWMHNELADTYRAAGATVIDRGSVLITHLGEIVRQNAASLLTRQSVQILLDAVTEASPVLAKEVDGERLSLSELQRVMSDLLEEGISVRNLSRIIEAVSARARENRSSESLLEAARAAIGPVICESATQDGALPALTFEPALEQALLESVRASEQGSWLSLDGMTLQRVMEALSVSVSEAEDKGYAPVLVCAAPLRPALRRMVASSRPDLKVLAYTELSRAVSITPLGEVALNSPVPAA